ncbi:hypothetical protein GN278_17200 [Rhodobacteraceae bacterium Araon29]
MFIDADGNKQFTGSSYEQEPLKTGKERTYSGARTGLSFWFDMNCDTVWTSRDDVFLHEHTSKDRDEPGFVFILHIEGRSIAFSKSPEKRFMLTSKDREDGSRYWEFGHIGAQHEKYTETLNVTDLQTYKMTNADKFANPEQQEFALTLLEDILTNFMGNWLGLAHGGVQSADVIFTQELQQKIARGDFVEGARQ